MEAMGTLILAILTVESSYSQEIERPVTTIADTVQFWFAPGTQWRIRTFSIDHDIHVHKISTGNQGERLTSDYAQANIQKSYGDVIDRMLVLSVPNPADSFAVRQLIDANHLERSLELIPDGYAFYNSEGGCYRTNSSPKR
jgi:hypothetical protein